MSESMYQRQIAQLTKDIAALERKRADELAKASKERDAAQRDTASAARSSSASVAQSKIKSALQHEKKASDHDVRAAKHGDEIARKRRSLATAERNLRSAQAKRVRAEEVARRRQRERDIATLRQIEDARRRLSTTTRDFEAPRPLDAEGDVPAPRSAQRREYDVCLSFAGEDRPYVVRVARSLQEEGLRVFYDEDEKVELWGKDLAEHFDLVYRRNSRYCVMFVSEAYARKPWTRHERRSALSRALSEEREYVLPVRSNRPSGPPANDWLHRN